VIERDTIPHRTLHHRLVMIMRESLASSFVILQYIVKHDLSPYGLRLICYYTETITDSHPSIVPKTVPKTIPY
jgi:hypothetical protein